MVARCLGISQLVAKRQGPSIEKRLQLLEEVTGSKEAGAAAAQNSS